MNNIDLEEAKVWAATALPLHAHDLNLALAHRFQVDTASAARIIKALELAGTIKHTTSDNGPVYAPSFDLALMHSYSFPLGTLADVWEQDFAPFIAARLTVAQRDLFKTSFLVTVQHAADYSRGTNVHVVLDFTAKQVEMTVQDNGIGFFRQLEQQQFTPAQAADRLAQQIRDRVMPTTINAVPGFDYFLIEANGMHYPPEAAPDETGDELFEQGTTIIMSLSYAH